MVEREHPAGQYYLFCAKHSKDVLPRWPNAVPKLLHSKTGAFQTVVSTAGRSGDLPVRFKGVERSLGGVSKVKILNAPPKTLLICLHRPDFQNTDAPKTGIFDSAGQEKYKIE